MRQWAAWILSGALILAGIVYKSWPLVSSGAAVLGFPGIVPQQTESNSVAIDTGSVGLPEVSDRERGTVQETMITRGGNVFGKRKQETEVKVEEAGSRTDTPFVPPDDTQVHNNHAPAQTAAEEDAIRGGRGERPTEEDE